MDLNLENGLQIIYHDADLVVVNKPCGLLSVPGRGPEKQDCVVNRLKRAMPGIIPQPAVHRLDMDTSGLMVLARTVTSHRLLSKSFQERRVQKRYMALVSGIVGENRGEIRLPFRLDPTNRPYQLYDPVHGKMSITLWQKVAVEAPFTRIIFHPLTGRTHQLRVHAAHFLGLGCAIAGDRLYGNARPDECLKLHAFFIGFSHPRNEKPISFEVPVPF